MCFSCCKLSQLHKLNSCLVIPVCNKVIFPKQEEIKKGEKISKKKLSFQWHYLDIGSAREKQHKNTKTQERHK